MITATARARSVLSLPGAAGLLIAAALLLAPAGQTADAQSRRERPRPQASAPTPQARPSRAPERPGRGPQERGGSDLSEWAQPDRGATSSSPAGQATTNGPSGTPDNPNRVPIGGLGWLVAAGAGYGIYRLREEDE